MHYFWRIQYVAVDIFEKSKSDIANECGCVEYFCQFETEAN